MKLLHVMVAVAWLLVLVAVIRSPAYAASQPLAGKYRRNTVWLVFFEAHDCPKCKAVKKLLEVVKLKYPVRIKTFDIEKNRDYALYKKLQAIHAPGAFGVPLIMLDDTILIGEDEITARLDKTVAGLVKAGGAPLPYLGPPRVAARHKKPETCNCGESGRPPSALEQWNSLKSYLNNIF
jgi:glutaredoxin